MSSSRFPYIVVAYLIAIVAANALVVTFGSPVVPLVAFLLVGFELTARSRLHTEWEGNHLALRMITLILVGGLLTYVVNASSILIGIASLVAFVMSAVASTAIYAYLRGHPWYLRVHTTNIVGAAVESYLLPTLIFGGPIWSIILAQFALKVVGGWLWSRLFLRFGLTFKSAPRGN